MYIKKLFPLCSGCGSVGKATLPTPEVHSSSPVICKLLYRTFGYCQLYRKDENREKEAGNGPFKKNKLCLLKSLTNRNDVDLNFFLVALYFRRQRHARPPTLA